MIQQTCILNIRKTEKMKEKRNLQKFFLRKKKEIDCQNWLFTDLNHESQAFSSYIPTGHINSETSVS